MLLGKIEKRLAEAEFEHGREAGSTLLIAVSKVQPNERVKGALEQGHRCFGENRVQEAASKWPAFRQQFADIDLHLIGPLQSNKARQAMELFDSIHSLDRPKLAQTLARIAQDLGKCPDIFIQVNTGKETTKSGVFPEDTKRFIDICRTYGLKNIEGLMCIPPINDDSSKHFQIITDLTKELGLGRSSIGMSDDYLEALDFDPKYVRLGTILFGKR